ncbi:MAG: hypothetical protein ACREEB_17945 [Caulobacteraceae bacterium]
MKMSNFELIVHDDRYSVPTHRMVAVTDERRVREIAERLLAESAHHHGVEVFEYGVRRFALGSAADRPIPLRPRLETRAD